VNGKNVPFPGTEESMTNLKASYQDNLHEAKLHD